MVRGVSNGIYVPADAEAVIEGYFDELGYREMEGPYGEFYGYYGSMHIDPVFHATAITMRRDAMFQTVLHAGRFVGRMDSANLASLNAEVAAWRLLRAARIEPVAINFSLASNGRQHARVALKRGKPGEARLALRLRSEHSSFALYRDVVVDLNEFPFLSWSWKVVRMPDQGDVRDRAADDQAAQVYVIFPRWPAPLRNSDVVGYVWDSRAPVGTQITSTKAANVKIIVVESGRSPTDAWRVEHRDVARDYAALFGRPAPRVGQVAVMIDTNDTRGSAEALIGDLIFARTRSESMESATSMLR